MMILHSSYQGAHAVALSLAYICTDQAYQCHRARKHTHTHLNTFSALPTTPPCILFGFLDGERGDWMDGKRGDSVDVTQQWREVTSDQHRLVRGRSSEPANIPAEEINMKHKQSQHGRVAALA